MTTLALVAEAGAELVLPSSSSISIRLRFEELSVLVFLCDLVRPLGVEVLPGLITEYLSLASSDKTGACVNLFTATVRRVTYFHQERVRQDHHRIPSHYQNRIHIRQMTERHLHPPRWNVFEPLKKKHHQALKYN